MCHLEVYDMDYVVGQWSGEMCASWQVEGHVLLKRQVGCAASMCVYSRCLCIEFFSWFFSLMLLLLTYVCEKLIARIYRNTSLVVNPCYF